MIRYRTYSVLYEHSDEDGHNRVVDRAVVTSYGGSELKLKQAVERERPGHWNIWS